MNSDRNDVCMVYSDKLDDELVLLSPQEENTADSFLRDKIYSQVVSDWSNTTTNLSENWKDYNVLRYNVSAALMSRWSELYDEYLKIVTVENSIKTDKEVFLVIYTVNSI